MKLRDQVVGFTLAEKLKELGVKQESLFCYQPIENEKASVWPRQFNLDEFANPSKDERIAAFTVSELGEILQWEKLYIFGFPEQMLDFVNGSNTEADARAKMVIHLLENGIIENAK